MKSVVENIYPLADRTTAEAEYKKAADLEEKFDIVLGHIFYQMKEVGLLGLADVYLNTEQMWIDFQDNCNMGTSFKHALSDYI